MNISRGKQSEDSDTSCALLVVGHSDLKRLGIQALGETTHVVPSVAEALGALSQREYAIILIELATYSISFECAIELRRSGIQTPLILIAASEPADTTRAQRQALAAVELVVEPFEPSVLCAKVRPFITLQQQRRELTRIRAMYDADRRLTRQHLQTLTAASAKLAMCMTTDAVVQTFVDEAHAAVGAVNSFVYLRRHSDERQLELAAFSGSPPGSLAQFRTLTVEQVLPVPAAVNSGEPVWVSDALELTARFPDLEPRGYAQAVGALPVVVNGKAVGAVAFSFREPKVWDIDEREFFLTLVAAFVAALERARLLVTERNAHEELERRSGELRLMADVGTLLSSSLDYESVLRQLSELVVPAVADWCTVDVLDADCHIQRVAAYHSDPAKVAVLHAIEERYPGDPNAAHGVANVLRTGELEWFADIPDAMLVVAAKDDAHLALLRSLGLRSFVAVPLKARGRILGVLSVVIAESERQYTLDEVRYIEELARRAALSLDNAKLFKQQVDAREMVQRQARHALLVGDVGTALTRSGELRDALHRCADAMVRHLNASLARIWTVDPRGDTLELQASAGVYALLDGNHAQIPLGAFQIGHIAQAGKPYLTNMLPLEPWARSAEWSELDGMVAFAGYPLIVDSRVIGVMGLFSRSELPSDTLTGLAAIADAVAIGIERARADQRARVERDTLEVVNQVGRALAAELDHETLVQSVTDYATRLAGAAFGAFFYNVVSPDGEAYTLYAISGVPRDAFAKFPMPRNTQVFAPTFAGDGVVRVDDIRKDPRYGHNFPHNGMPEGHLPVASYLAVPVVSRTGTVIGGLFFGHPQASVFTERHEVLVTGVAAQAAIAMDNARLFEEAQRLIAKLDKSNQELDQFAYVASHDLKAPLRGISNLSQWLEEDLGAAITPTAKEQLGLLRNRVQRLEGLINGILNYSRAGRGCSKVESVSVSKLLVETLEMMSVPTGAAIEVQSDLPELQTERVPLQQVFMNLISNALKHAKRLDPCVSIAATDAEDFVEFAVTDNGAGIAPEFHERIWGIFQTLAPRDEVEGTGIGLSVVKKIVENKGGAVGLKSSSGAGATFWFTWPKAERAEP